jgi:hypothetical protein
MEEEGEREREREKELLRGCQWCEGRDENPREVSGVRLCAHAAIDSRQLCENANPTINKLHVIV